MEEIKKALKSIENLIDKEPERDDMSSLYSSLWIISDFIKEKERENV